MKANIQPITIVGISINNPQYSKKYVSSLVKNYPSSIFLCSDGIAIHNFRALNISSKKSFADFAKKISIIPMNRKINWIKIRQNNQYRTAFKKIYKLYQNNNEFKKDLESMTIASLSSLAKNHNLSTQFSVEQIRIATRFILEELAVICWYGSKYGTCVFIYHKEFEVINKIAHGYYGIKNPQISAKISSI